MEFIKHDGRVKPSNGIWQGIFNYRDSVDINYGFNNRLERF